MKLSPLRRADRVSPHRAAALAALRRVVAAPHRRLLAVLAAGAICAAAGGALASGLADASSVDRCVPAGRELAHSSEVVVWARHGEVDLYACVQASGSVHSIANTGEGAEDLAVAGDYVAFQYRAGAQTTYLDLFDALSGRTEIGALLISCPGDGCPEGTDPWRLAPSGWVAYVAQFGAGGLVATDGRHTTPALDEGPLLGDLRLSGSTLTWSPDGSAHYAAPLGAGLESLASKHAAPPRPRPSACALVMATDVEAVLGPITAAAASAGGGCVYTSTGKPSGTATVTLAAGLSPAQVSAAKRAAYGQELKMFGGDRDEVGSPGYGRYDWSASWEAGSGGSTRSEDVRFVGNVGLTAEVAIAVPYSVEESEAGGPQIGAGRWHTDTAAAHFSDIALDRLMGWRVRQAP